MTQEQKAQLLLAIERAEGPGACSYKAGCVIAQLADIVDPGGETRRELARMDYQNVKTNPAGPRLAAFGLDVLVKVQDVWDRCGSKVRGAKKTPEEARTKMRALVEAA